MGYPRFRRARAHKFATRTSGNIALGSITLADVDNGLDLTLDAQVGDVIEVGLSGRLGSEANTAYLNAATIVGGSRINVVQSGPVGAYAMVGAWFAQNTGVATSIGGAVMYTLQAGDISNGQVTLRLVYTTDVASPTRTLHATANPSLQWYAKNIGPVDPN